MLQRRLVTGLVLVALLAVTTVADASLCNANCAFATPGSSRGQHVDHSQSSPLMAQHHHHQGGLPADTHASNSFLSSQSPQCSVYSQLQALVNASKVSLAKTALFAERVTVDRTLPSASALSSQDPFLPNWVHSPPESNQPSIVAPLRI